MMTSCGAPEPKSAKSRNALSCSEDFVVGRRGTGKSALFVKLAEHFASDNHTTLVTVAPAEHETMDLQRLIRQCGSTYRQLRALTRLVWKIQILFTSGKAAQKHHQALKTATAKTLSGYLNAHSEIASTSGARQAIAILKFGMLHGGADPQELPGFLAATFRIEDFKVAVDAALREQAHTVVLAYDGLDEGWEPEVTSTSILGGLAIATADLTDARVPIRPVLFIRDNMFRALAAEDNDWAGSTACATPPARTFPPPPRLRRARRSVYAKAGGFDVLACPRCDGRLRLIALIEEAAVIGRILRHLGVPTEIPVPCPARAPPLCVGAPDQAGWNDDTPLFLTGS